MTKTIINRKGVACNAKTVALALALAFTFGCEKESNCGEAKYNPETQFCGQGFTVYEKCKGEKYNPDEKICVDGKITEKCGEKGYDTETQFCSGDKVYGKCSGEEYKAEAQFCSGGKVHYKCWGETYNPETQFCSTEDYGVQNLCEGKEFNPEKKFCPDGKLTDLPKCYGKMYNPETHSCINGLDLIENDKNFYFNMTDEEEYKPIGDCSEGRAYNEEKHGCCGINDGGADLYDLGKAFCSVERYEGSGRIYKKCSGNEYNPRTHYCKGKKIQEFKCAGKSFSLEYQEEQWRFCVNDVLYDACGGPPAFSIYNPKTQVCEDGAVVDK